MAALTSLTAFSTDSVLPAMTALGAELAPDNKNMTQLVVTSFLFGSGFGMLIFGPLADTIGRRRSLVVGVAIYILASLAASIAQNLEMLVALRLLAGIGAAAARTVAQTVTRDLFSGAEQARVSSLIFMFFVLVPAVAPLIGQQIIWAVGWRGLFMAYVAFGLATLAWFLMRQPETLKPEFRRPFRLRPIFAAAIEVATNKVSSRYALVQILLFGQFIAYLSSAEQLFVDAIGVGDRFPIYFALVSVFSAGAGFLNARVVVRYGMRRMAALAFGLQVIVAGLAMVFFSMDALQPFSHTYRLSVFLIWSTVLFAINGLTMGNIIALAMEPLGHIAGTATAVLGALGMMAGLAIAVPVGMAFDGTPRPVITGAIICSSLAFLLVWTDLRSRARFTP